MNSEECDKREIRNTKKKTPRQKRNPIESAIVSWYEKHALSLKHHHELSSLIAQAPKRWTAYGPLVLLPAGSFTSLAWRDALNLAAASCIPGVVGDSEKRNSEDEGPTLLWKTILAEISGSKLTHLAINEGIPLLAKYTSEGAGPTAGGGENILRSPSGLRMLYGDFGPSTLIANSEPNNSSTREEVPSRSTKVTEDDFSRAFWVSTKQNGITQTWAPRWTMFSRGNIKEKVRLLGFHDPGDTQSRHDHSHLSHRHIPAEQRAGAVAVDLYAGIGYFAFCYAALGFRVFCWELNPWSVEGLRRGAEANGWSVRVVVPRDGRDSDNEEDEEILRDVLAGDETIVVFLEDNTLATSRIRKMDELTRAQREGTEDKDVGLRMRNIMHVNCGLLPSSEGSWETAWDIASEARQAWFHIHENVGAADVDVRKGDIRQWFAERDDRSGVKTELCVEHVELVKTFAPGVWHCVFDLYVGRCRDKTNSIM
ncbi:hypothetical protein HD806DRAFT_78245 [Xylariaceae sp. AK1471]|nr:hypothetical protein HD806DRAFT_78245 [Xylariaceae sp. AK1471]